MKEVLQLKADYIKPLLSFGGLETKKSNIPIVLEKPYFQVSEIRQLKYKQVMSTAIVSLLQCSTYDENQIGTLWSILQLPVMKRLDRQAEPSQVLAEVITIFHINNYF